MIKNSLKYIIDPHCGWSFATNEEMRKLKQQLSSLYDFELLSGGMWLAQDAPRGGKSVYDFIRPGVERVNQLGFNVISDHYLDLINDPSYLLSSEWPSYAIIAFKQMNKEKQFEFAFDLMELQFKQGLRYDIEKNYHSLVAKYGVDLDEFISIWKSDDLRKKSMIEFEEAKNYAQAYPTLILQHKTGFEVVRRGAFKAEDVIEELKNWTPPEERKVESD